MIVQPLVENAVYHGLEKTYKDGRLSIVGKIEAESMLLEIRDNGPGMSAETLEKIRRALSDPVKLEKESINKQKIGIANIQWRIRLKYGELYGLNISSAADGTLVQVKLPLEPNK
jgi:two-component system sensor histidine kinase YesM